MKQIFANDVHDGYPPFVVEKAPGAPASQSCLRGGWEAAVKMAAQLARAGISRLRHV